MIIKSISKKLFIQSKISVNYRYSMLLIKCKTLAFHLALHYKQIQLYSQYYQL